jgi:uncharacterized protein (DUF433 family)
MDMPTDLIHDRGRGPEIAGTRITVYNLLPHFLDPTATEAYLCKVYELTPEQVAAARAYVLNNTETVLAKHLQIEAKMAAGNPQQVIEQAKKTHATFLKFKEWLDERQQTQGMGLDSQAESASGNGQSCLDSFPTFREWLAEQESRPLKGP